MRPSPYGEGVTDLSKPNYKNSDVFGTVGIYRKIEGKISVYETIKGALIVEKYVEGAVKIDSALEEGNE